MATIELTNKELLDVWEALNYLRNQVCEIKLAYAVARNTRALRNLVDAYNEAVALPAAVRALETKRVALCEKHAQRDAQGNPVARLVDGQSATYQMQDQAVFEAAWAALVQENEEAAQLRSKHLEATREILKEKVTVELHTIDLAKVKLDLPPRVLEALLDRMICEVATPAAPPVEAESQPS